MAGGTFEAECDKCGEKRPFEEFSREMRRVTSAQRGDFKFDQENSFRCTVCGWRTDKLVDTAGVLHKWNGAKHATFKVE